VLLASPAFTGRSVKDVIAQAKAQPKSLSFALTGIGSSGHMSMELLKQAAGIDFTSVPYKGDAPAITDMLGGQVHLLFVNSSAAAAQVKGGKLRALAVTGKSRNALLPDVPTMAEAGLPNVLVESWVGFSGPAKLSPEIVTRLNRALNNAVDSTEVKARLFALGLTPSPGTPQQYADYINDEVDKWSKVVKAANIRAE
jgi:tripartite-type tricarboxylate transporter receptor subunit TctC